MIPDIKIWRPRELPGFEVKRGLGVTHSHPGHWHDELHIVLVDGGAGELIHRGIHHSNPPGWLFVVPPGEVHANRPTVEEGCSFRTVNLSLDSLSASEDVLKALENMPVWLTRRPDLGESFTQFHESLSVATDLLERESRMHAFLSDLLAHVGVPLLNPSAGDEPSAVRAAREFLDAHSDRNVSLAELTLVTGLSPYHLVRVFKRATGLPPHAYLKGRKIARARALLNQGWRPVDVSARLGFADQPHFTRTFKQIVGVPPAHFQGGSKNIQDPIHYIA